MVHVLSVEPFDGEAEVYDITVEKDHSYIVGGVVVHNCLRCGPLDNKVYPLGKGPKAPLHMNCRCVRVPVIKGRDKLIKAGLLKEGTRASIDGQVPDSLKFEDWLRRQSPDRQKEVLGAKRFELFKRGVKLNKFVNDENDIIPLNQLASGAPRTVKSADLRKADRQARQYVLKKGRASGVEHLVAIDQKTGQVIERAVGTRSNVKPSQAVLDRMFRADEDIIVHHNHPGSSSLSIQDMLMTTYAPGISGVWAHGHTGSSYFAQRLVRELPQRVAESVRDNVGRRLQAAYNAGEISQEAAESLIMDLVWKVFAKRGDISYTSILRGQTKKLYDQHTGVLDRIVSAYDDY